MYIYCETIFNTTWFIFLGNFDALLQWPFSFRVTFMLLDQNNKEHQVDSFRPDPNSSSFKRPTTEMNIASGCPLFIPLAKLDDPSLAYVKEDTMFIKLVVDVPRGWSLVPNLPDLLMYAQNVYDTDWLYMLGCPKFILPLTLPYKYIIVMESYAILHVYYRVSITGMRSPCADFAKEVTALII